MRSDRPGRILALGCALVMASTLAACTGDGAGTGSGSAAGSPTAATAGATPSWSPGSGVTPGDITQTVEAKKQKTSKPVDLDEKQHSDDITVSLKSIDSRRVKAVGPGEVGGPALVVTVRIDNDSSRDLNVDSAYVTVLDSRGQVGMGLTNSPARPFTGSVPAGDSATGVYVFHVDKAARSPIKVTVTYSADHPTALFVGDAD